jgi:hypothetical protein
MRARCSAVILLLVLLLVPQAAGAEPGQMRGVTLGLTAVQPLPPWNDAGFGLAPCAGFTLPVWGRWSATARASWIGHVDKRLTVGDGSGGTIRYEAWELPILVGVEYAGRGAHGFLFCGEVGYVLRSSRADYAHEPTASSIDHGAGIGIGGGYRIWDFQARAQLFMLGIPDPVKHKAVMFGVQWLLPV